MTKKYRDNARQKPSNNTSKTDLPDIKTNAQTKNKGASMKRPLGSK